MELQKVFHNVQQDANLGKNTVWPKPPPTLGTADILIHKIHKTWRASQIIKRIPKDQVPYIKQKIITCDIFKGKKPYEYVKYYFFYVERIFFLGCKENLKQIIWIHLIFQTEINMNKLFKLYSKDLV